MRRAWFLASSSLLWGLFLSEATQRVFSYLSFGYRVVRGGSYGLDIGSYGYYGLCLGSAGLILSNTLLDLLGLRSGSYSGGKLSFILYGTSMGWPEALLEEISTFASLSMG